MRRWKSGNRTSRNLLALVALGLIMCLSAAAQANVCPAPAPWGFTAEVVSPAGGTVPRDSDITYRICVDTSQIPPDPSGYNSNVAYISMEVPVGTLFVPSSTPPDSVSGNRYYWLFYPGTDVQCVTMIVHVPPGYQPATVTNACHIDGYDSALSQNCDIPLALDVTGALAAPLLDLQTVSAVYGGKMRMPLTLTTNGMLISGTSDDICYDTYFLSHPRAELGQAASDAGKSLEFNDFGTDGYCTGYVFYGSPGHLRLGVIGLGMGDPQPISDGRLALLTFDLKADEANFLTTLGNIDKSVTTPDAVYVEAGGLDGWANFTSTPGDCDFNNVVNIAEVQSGVNMWAGPPEDVQGCADYNGDGIVMINEVQLIILSYLYGPPAGYAGDNPQALKPAKQAKPARLSLGAKSGKPGDTLVAPVTLTTRGTPISAVAFDIAYDPNLLESPSATIAPQMAAAGKYIKFSSPSPGIFRVGVIGLNSTTLPDGLAAKVSFTIKGDAKPGRTALAIKPSASDPSAGEAQIQAAKSSIKINKKRGR